MNYAPFNSLPFNAEAAILPAFSVGRVVARDLAGTGFAPSGVVVDLNDARAVFGAPAAARDLDDDTSFFARAGGVREVA